MSQNPKRLFHGDPITDIQIIRAETKSEALADMADNWLVINSTSTPIDLNEGVTGQYIYYVIRRKGVMYSPIQNLYIYNTTDSDRSLPLNHIDYSGTRYKIYRMKDKWSLDYGVNLNYNVGGDTMYTWISKNQ
jgi:hypothetical protein